MSLKIDQDHSRFRGIVRGKVREWMAAQTHRPVTPTLYGHSGASVAGSSKDPDEISGEVPSANPGVAC